MSYIVYKDSSHFLFHPFPKTWTLFHFGRLWSETFVKCLRFMTMTLFICWLFNHFSLKKNFRAVFMSDFTHILDVQEYQHSLIMSIYVNTSWRNYNKSHTDWNELLHPIFSPQPDIIRSFIATQRMDSEFMNWFIFVNKYYQNRVTVMKKPWQLNKIDLNEILTFVVFNCNTFEYVFWTSEFSSKTSHEPIMKISFFCSL